MQIKLFGKSLFEFKKNSNEYLFNTAVDSLKASKFLIDFYKDVGGGMEVSISDYAVIEGSSGLIAVKTNKKLKKADKPLNLKITPKGVYELRTLHDDTYKLKTDPAYIDAQLQQFKDKLSMIKSSESDWNRGTNEIGSIIMRLENRKKYPKHAKFFEEFPYTTSAKIVDLTKTHTNLKLGEVQQFVADMPQEAVDVMKRYTKECEALCDKKPVFYIIADKEDFRKSEKRRDPILLAQSPFGHCWQILGAWDKEMILVEEL